MKKLKQEILKILVCIIALVIFLGLCALVEFLADLVTIDMIIGAITTTMAILIIYYIKLERGN